MKYISHRGNTNGRIPHRENSKDYIIEAIEAGFDVEIDVWQQDGKLWLGHDRGDYPCDSLWLLQNSNKLWCHAKNIPALHTLLLMKMHCFYHLVDDVTLTSNGYLWTFPGKELTYLSIAVMPEIAVCPKNSTWGPDVCYGICSDFISDYKESCDGR